MDIKVYEDKMEKTRDENDINDTKRGKVCFILNRYNRIYINCAFRLRILIRACFAF